MKMKRLTKYKRTKYSSSPWTVAERFIDDVINETEPHSKQRFGRVNVRAQQVRAAIARMTPDQFTQWKADYYSGMMVPPFGFDNGNGHDEWNLVPYGFSEKYNLPRLSEADTDEVIDRLLEDSTERISKEL
jgi:hypothetical protein